MTDKPHSVLKLDRLIDKMEEITFIAQRPECILIPGGLYGLIGNLYNNCYCYKGYQLVPEESTISLVEELKHE